MRGKSFVLNIELYGEKSLSVSYDYWAIAIAYNRLGKGREAVEFYLKAERIRKPNDLFLIGIYAGKARGFYLLKKTDQARAEIEKAMALIKRGLRIKLIVPKEWKIWVWPQFWERIFLMLLGFMVI